MTIKKKGDGNWEYCVYLGQDENGKKKYKRKCGFKTRKACIEEASKFENEKTKNKNNTKTFREVGLMYLEDCKNRGIRKTTLDIYDNRFNMISKNFKKINYIISKITTKDIIEFIYDSYFMSLSYNYKKSLLFLLKSIFIYATKQDLIKKDIFNKIPTIRKNVSVRNIWGENELKKYLPKLKNFRYFDVVYLALETGMRRGELLALTWDCIDFEKGSIFINKSYATSKNFTGFNQPKTISGIREIILLKRSLEILKSRYKNHHSNYVFPNKKNPNKPLSPTLLTKSFKNFLYKNNIRPIHFHDLRHIHATFLLKYNIDYKILSKRLGHTNIAFTLQTYTHVIPENEAKLLKNLPQLY